MVEKRSSQQCFSQFRSGYYFFDKKTRRRAPSSLSCHVSDLYCIAKMTWERNLMTPRNESSTSSTWQNVHSEDRTPRRTHRTHAHFSHHQRTRVGSRTGRLFLIRELLKNRFISLMFQVCCSCHNCLRTSRHHFPHFFPAPTPLNRQVSVEREVGECQWKPILQCSRGDS